MAAIVSLSPVSPDTHPVPLLEVVAGMTCEFYFRRRWRAAKVLAVRDQEALIEYQLGYSSGLRILWLPSLQEAVDRDRPVRYNELPAVWIETLAA